MRSLIMAVILAILFTWFALANSQMVSVSIFMWNSQISLSMVILISILIGVVFTGIVSASEQARMMKKIRELEKDLKSDEGILKGESK
jgi:uncharacterized integral membrane protein